MRPHAALAVVFFAATAALAGSSHDWSGYGRDSQHTAQSAITSKPLRRILWSTPVDLNPQYTNGDLSIHYGSPMVASRKTVVVPVKVGLSDGFRVEGHDAGDGSLRWSQATDFTLAPHDWTPSFPATLDPKGRLYLAGSGGTLYWRDNLDNGARASSGQIAFYGIDNYLANPGAYDAGIFVNTPLTSDSSGNVYFGFYVTGPTPLFLVSGIARISSSGAGSWVSTAAASGDGAMIKVPHDSAPALSNDESTLYVAVSNGGSGYLLALDAASLATKARVRLLDPFTSLDALLSDNATSSPVVGPDGDVYYGVKENRGYYHHGRGWLLHFDAQLAQVKLPGSFGWDDTPSIVPLSAVRAYSGSSSYLLMSKYNDYLGIGGMGDNRLAILDPNTPQADPITGAPVMREVMTISGQTPDSAGGVREWCINSAAVDPGSRSILANSEDGVLYRWDLGTNSFTERMVLTAGVGEAYTPTLIGPDGTVYAINDAILFAVGR